MYLSSVCKRKSMVDVGIFKSVCIFFSPLIALLFFYSAFYTFLHFTNIVVDVLFLGFQTFDCIRTKHMEISRLKCIKSIECLAQALPIPIVKTSIKVFQVQMVT